MVQRYFIQFNKSLTRDEQHDESRFALFFAGFTIAFAAFGINVYAGVRFIVVLLLPTL